jgi:subtilisin family serine protease
LQQISRSVLWLAVVGACTPGGVDDVTQAATSGTSAIDDTITLITGDRVQLSHGSPIITRAPGNRHVMFSIQHDGDDLIVLPSDAVPRIASGELERALFNVTRLLADGYGDAKRADLPLIVTGTALAPGLVASGGVVDHSFRAIPAVAVRQPKGRALAPALAGARIQLDHLRRPTLDHSVPQIGGDVAHARGLTGAGVIVGVIDTGVDTSHPDLATQVTAAENFTDDGGDGHDVVGHGTHVASIIAGTGAASGGQLAGVAPGARLVSGRACEELGCLDSWMIAAMEWAVLDQHAQIVNISIGGPDTPGIDALEAEVAQLSAQFGTLFVIAAGNDFTDGSIESPGSADAALTVGAVDRDDQLASFSSRGPRSFDHAIKPDLTAPGVEIVAARASGVPPIGTPVGTAYQALSGTSMATPHVAGAAALVLQQHPEWTGADLKRQLIGTATPIPGFTVFQQGAGRVDVDRATRQAVTADPASLSLGIQAFPHDDDPPTTATVTYRNPGAAPVTLAITGSLALRDGTPLPVALSAGQLVVPAGGTAALTVTVATAGDVADGLYGGAVVATAGDLRIETPIAIEREAESFDVHVQIEDVDGSTGFAFLVVSRGTQLISIVDVFGDTTLRLPRGRYAIEAISLTSPDYQIVAPRVDVDHALSLDFDAQTARGQKVTLPDPDLVRTATFSGFVDRSTGHTAQSLSFGELLTAHLGPEIVPADELVSWVWFNTSDTLFDSKVMYELAHPESGHFVTGWTETLTADQFATIEAHHAATDNSIAFKGATPFYIDHDRELVPGGGLAEEDHVPYDRIEHYFGPGFLWQTSFDQSDESFQTLRESRRIARYRPGQHLTERWNRAPFGPGLGQDVELRIGPRATLVDPATRTGDTLTLTPSLVSEQGEPARAAVTVRNPDGLSLVLRRDGQVIADQLDPLTDQLPPVVVPPGPATYQLDATLQRPALFSLSTEVSASWTFRSRHAAGTEVLPLLTPRFQPALADDNTSSARAMILPVVFARPVGAARSPIVRAQVEVSFDDGASWERVPTVVLGDRALAVFAHRRGAAFVSLRGAATDLAGNRGEVRIIRAYGLAR